LAYTLGSGPEHIVKLRAGKRATFGRALHLYKFASRGHGHIHVHLGSGILAIVQIQKDLSSNDPYTNGGKGLG
jgi:hypothetical protein